MPLSVLSNSVVCVLNSEPFVILKSSDAVPFLEVNLSLFAYDV